VGIVATIMVVSSVVGLFFLKESLRQPDRAEVKDTSGYKPNSWTLFAGVGQSSSKMLAIPSSPKQFSTFSGAFDLDGLTVVEFVAKYSALARTDPQWAYRVYQAEALCANLDIVKNAAEVMKQSHQADWYAQAANDATEACQGVGPAIMEERYQLVQRAAQAGVDRARIDFAFEGPAGNPPRGDPNREQWTKQMVGFLNDSIHDGNRSSLLMLSDLYKQGALIPQDLRQALVYQAAFAQVVTGKPDGLLPVTEMSEHLPPEVVKTALQVGAALGQQVKARQS
jgi:hypothetical protein